MAEAKPTLVRRLGRQLGRWLERLLPAAADDLTQFSFWRRFAAKDRADDDKNVIPPPPG